MRIVTWNVNGIRRIHREYQRKGIDKFSDLLAYIGGDVICLQELKAEKATIDPVYVYVPGWRSYFTFPIDKKAYSGVAIYVKNPYRPVNVETALCAPDYASNSPTFVETDAMIGCYPDRVSINDARLIDREGRVVLLDFVSFILIGTYCPAGAEAEERVSYRKMWWQALNERCIKLISAGKRLVIVGDLNVNCHAIDTVDATEDEYKYDNLGPVSRTFHDWLSAPVFLDLTRHFHPQRTKMFTCWSVRLAARAGNHGSRIDYVLISPDLAEYMLDSDVQTDIHGSDHCPVYADLQSSLKLSEASENDKEMSNFTTSQATLGNMFFRPVEKTMQSPKRVLDVTSMPIKKQKTIAAFFATSSSADQAQPVEKRPAVPQLQYSQSSQSIERRAEVSHAFSTLFTKPEIPLCDGHQKPAKLQKTKKKGPNMGREFWSCPVDLGNGQCKFWRWRK